MKTKYTVLILISTLYQQNAFASSLDITSYKYPFKGNLVVKMRLENICDENKAKKLIEKRGIPSNSPQYQMMENMMKTQCTQAQANHLQDSIAYDIKGKKLNEVFDSNTSKNVSLFNITLKQYESKNALESAWEKITKGLKNENTNNSDYILVNGAYNSAYSFMSINNTIIQSDLMLSNGSTLDQLRVFTKKYSSWLNKHRK